MFSTTYAPGDRLLLFTDGLFEVRAHGGGIWGEESLRSAFVGFGRHSPQGVVAEILREAARFGGVRAFDDDVSVLVAQLGIRSPSFRTPPADCVGTVR